MRSIPLTRYNQPKSFREREKKRCSNIYVEVKRQQKRIESLYTADVLVENLVMRLALSHLRAGVILRKYNLHSIAAEQFERAYQLLVQF